tara:strand:+ start:917 stop:1462 length:546 start_codon:yes stop_codon:yes gene_type:complete
MMDPLEFYRDVCAPTIDGLGLHKNQEDFRSGMQLTFGAILHESGGLKLRRQIGGGPGLGLGQIEGATLRDFQKNWLAFRPEYLGRIDEFADAERTWFDQLTDNDRLAVALTRMLFFRVPEPLPAADDLLGHARYWKQHYNTELGKGTVAKYIADVRHHADWLYPERAWEEAESEIANGATA